MDKEKAKFILGAYQAGLPATEQDGEMSAALEAARDDAELGEWLRQQMEFDERVSAAFRDIAVPQSLRRNILEGMELSVQKRAWWRKPAFGWGLGLGGLATAAVAVLLVALPLISPKITPTEPEGVASRYEPWQRNALAKLNDGFDLEVHRGSDPGLSKDLIAGWLKAKHLPVPDSVLLKLTDEQLVGCFAMSNLPGDKASTICFNSKEGPVIHIVSHEVPVLAEGTRLPDFGAPEGKPTPGTFGHLNTLSWRESNKAIMLVSDAAQENLFNVIR